VIVISSDEEEQVTPSTSKQFCLGDEVAVYYSPPDGRYPRYYSTSYPIGWANPNGNQGNCLQPTVTWDMWHLYCSTCAM